MQPSNAAARAFMWEVVAAAAGSDFLGALQFLFFLTVGLQSAAGQSLGLILSFTTAALCRRTANQHMFGKAPT